jgi:hypothetical protein
VTRSALAALALVAALVCTACSDDDPQPDFAPPESTSPAPTETPTPTEPPEQKLSPEKTVRAWVEARNITVQNGDTEAVYELSTTDCKTCRHSIEPVAAVYERGGHYETSGWKVEDVKQRANFEHTHEVAAAIKYAAGRTFHDEEADPVRYRAEHHVLLFGLVRLGGLWKVDEILYAS